MSDIFTKAKRSDVMSRIRSRGNKDTEVALARLFRANGIKGWRRHVRITVKLNPNPTLNRNPNPNLKFSVRPDFVFKKARLAIFVDGCFWHACPKHGTWPVKRAAWWRKKILGNQTRDQLVTRTLRRAGWRVWRVWEHELARKNQERLLRKMLNAKILIRVYPCPSAVLSP